MGSYCVTLVVYCVLSVPQIGHNLFCKYSPVILKKRISSHSSILVLKESQVTDHML